MWRRRRHALGDGAGGGARATHGEGAAARSGTSSSPARRTARSTTTSASRRRCRRRGFGPPRRLHPAGRGRRRARAVRAHARCRAPIRRTAGTPCTSSTTAGRMDGFYDAAQDNGDGNDSMPYYTAQRAAVLLQPVRQLRALRELLLLAARADLAEPLLPDVRHVRRDHDERHLGLRHLRLGRWPIILDLLDDAGVTLEDLQHRRLDDVADGRQRQRRGLLEPLGARPAHDRDEGRLPATTAGAARCRRSRG